MRTAAQQAGDAAEALVADYLAHAGWSILGRKVHVGRSELDLVAVDPFDHALVIVEVRWRSRRDFGLAEETIQAAKLGRMQRAAFVLLEKGRLADGTQIPRLQLRFDLVGVEPGGRLRHHRHLGAR